MKRLDMNQRWTMKLWVILLVACSVAPLVAYAAGEAAANSATTPVSRPDPWWTDRHNAMNDRVKQGNVDLIFIGDSITQGWEGEGKDVWQKYYAKRNAVNLGISGDQTQHVLWRLDNGNINGIAPKLAVIMIGTNNYKSNSVEEIGAGITAIVKKLREKLPQMKVLVLAIFPREEKPGETRDNLAKASQIASKTADNKMVFFSDIGAKFLDADGTLPKLVMPDALHPNAKGYEIWAGAIEPQIAELMGEAKAK